MSSSFVPANRYDSVMAPGLFYQLEELDVHISFVLGDAAYDSQEVRKAANDAGTQLMTPINKRNGKRKDSYGRVMPTFLDPVFRGQLFHLRNGMERLFHTLKDKGLENARMFVQPLSLSCPALVAYA